MKLESKFNVGDLIQHKFTRQIPFGKAFENKMLVFYEVMDVQTQTCCAGTQIHYIVSAIHAALKDEKPVAGQTPTIIEFVPGFTPDNRVIKFREDECISIPEWIKNELLALNSLTSNKENV